MTTFPRAISPNRCRRPGCKGRGRVISTRERNGTIRRRRECLRPGCRFRWTTVERIEDEPDAPPAG